MPIKILMPALSPTMTEGNLAKWHKGEGDSVEPGDVLAEIETDKATMEVEAVDSGTLGKIVVSDGTNNVAVNEVIAFLLEDGEDSGSIDASASPVETVVEAIPAAAPESPAVSGNAAPKATPLARRLAEQAGIDLSTVTGTGARGKITRADIEALTGTSAKPGSLPAAVTPTPSGDRLFASPLARRLANDAGLDLAAIAGTGPQGRIVKADVEKAKLAPAAEVVGTPVAIVEVSESDRYDIVPMSAMRKVVAERMVHSKSNVPHFYLSVDCEIDELLKVRSSLNERLEDGKLSVNDFIIRACALALMEIPEANASWVGDGTMRLYKTADISVAVALDDGLITPIIPDAESKGLADISAKMKDLAVRARDGKLAPEEYQGGSFTISNLGMFGIKQFDAVINEPQGCILAVGAGEPRPVVKNGEIVPATVMTCTLSCDHRVVDGATGAKLLSAIKRLIEYPPAMLL
jgi:pyruvate dehydrogenase E2 component (dihydrolipoamide acetyltransferase)